MKDKVKVLILAANTTTSDALTAHLILSLEMQVVGAGSIDAGALVTISSSDADIILMEITGRDALDLEPVRRIINESKTKKVILISSNADKELVLRGVEYGIDGYVVGNIENGVLIDAVRTVHSGQKYFSESIRNIVFDDFYLRENTTTKQASKLNRALSTRESEILEHIVSGKTNAQVAATLLISIKTVETHKANIREKLGLKNTVELVKYAIRNNIISI